MEITNDKKNGVQRKQVDRRKLFKKLKDIVIISNAEQNIYRHFTSFWYVSLQR